MIRFFHFLADDRLLEEERVMDEQSSCVWMDERDEDVGDPSWRRCSADAAAAIPPDDVETLPPPLMDPLKVLEDARAWTAALRSWFEMERLRPVASNVSKERDRSRKLEEEELADVAPPCHVRLSCMVAFAEG